MPGKNFKDSPALAFIGNNDAKGTQDTTDEMAHPYFRFNLKLKSEYKEYLKWASWRDQKSVTRYINDLIEADRGKNRDGN
jgi:hypothetical protein